MTAFIIVIVAILSVVGSVVWVRPSHRDVKLAKWRQQARVAGLQVKLEGLKAEPKESGIREDVGGASYYLHLPKAQKGDDVSWAVVKTEGWLNEGLDEGWSWYLAKPLVDLDRVRSLIASCPVPIDAIERTPVRSRVIWAEAGKDFDAKQLADFLKEVQSIC